MNVFRVLMTLVLVIILAFLGLGLNVSGAIHNGNVDVSDELSDSLSIIAGIDSSDIINYPDGTYRSKAFVYNAFRFVTLDDPVVVGFYKGLEPWLTDDPWTNANLILKTVHSWVHYNSDMELHGVEEYTQYPSETIITGRGDCEDMALLLYTLYVLNGLDAVLITTDNHISVGVNIDGDGQSVIRMITGQRYLISEATSSIGIIGQSGLDYKKNFAFKPTPIIQTEFYLLLMLGTVLVMACLTGKNQN